MSILDQNFAPTPQQALAAAPKYIPPVQNGSGNALANNLQDLAGAFDKTYVARLKLQAEQKRQAVLDQRFATGEQRKAEHYKTSQAQQSVMRKIAKENHSILKARDASRVEAAKLKKQQANTTKELLTGANFPAQQEGETPLAYGQRTEKWVYEQGMAPEQSQQVVSQFRRSKAGIDSTAAQTNFTKDYATFKSATADYAQQDVVLRGIDEEIKALAADKNATVPDSPVAKQLDGLYKAQREAKIASDKAYATVQHIVDSNHDVKLATNKMTTTEVLAKRAKESAEAAEQARIDEQTNFGTGTLDPTPTDTEEQLGDAMSGFGLPTVEQQGYAVHDAARGVLDINERLGQGIVDTTKAIANSPSIYDMLRDNVGKPVGGFISSAMHGR